MDSSHDEATPTQSPSDGSASPVRLAFDADAKKHFDAFETLFFQQGEEENLPGANDAYDDGEPRIKRWLPYRVLLGISVASTTVAVFACIALWRNNTPAATELAASAAPQVVATAPVAVAVAPAAPTPTAAEPSAEEPAAAVPPPVAALAAEEPAAAAPAPVLPTVAPAPTEPAVAPAPTPTPAVAVKTAEPAPAPSAEPAEPAVAQAEPAKAEKANADSPSAKTGAPADNETRERCRQSIRGRKAKDIVAVCSAAFEQDATDAEAAVAVAKVEFDRGRFTQAYNWSKKAIAVNPATADAYVYAGGAEQNQGHGKAAKEAYLQYLRLAPSGRYAAELRTIVNSL